MPTLTIYYGSSMEGHVIQEPVETGSSQTLEKGCWSCTSHPPRGVMGRGTYCGNVRMKAGEPKCSLISTAVFSKNLSGTLTLLIPEKMESFQ